MINMTVTIWCDKCGGPQISYTPPLGALVRDAMVTAEERAIAAGWDAEGIYHMCPSCAREKKHGPAQPSGNSGGFIAASGILKDTWDDESSEDAIRRIRDGTPREEATMEQVEVERDKLRDRVLDLEGEATDLLQELEDAEYEAESRLS